MINVTFPDGQKKQFEKGIVGYEIDSSISRAAMVVEVDGTLTNLSVPIHTDCNFRILTEKDPEVLDIIRHDVAHIIAEAAKKNSQKYK